MCCGVVSLLLTRILFIWTVIYIEDLVSQTAATTPAAARSPNGLVHQHRCDLSCSSPRASFRFSLSDEIDYFSLVHKKLIALLSNPK